MATRLKDGNRLTVKASRNYLYPACGFLVFSVFAFLIAFVPEQFANDPILDRLALVGLAALPSVYFILIYWNKRVEVDGAGITPDYICGYRAAYSLEGEFALEEGQWFLDEDKDGFCQKYYEAILKAIGKDRPTP